MNVRKKSCITVVILGSSGLLGKQLGCELELQGINVVRASEVDLQGKKIDLRNLEETHTFLGCTSPDVVINLVALTNVDECERNPSAAYSLNVTPVKNVVSWIKNGNQKCHLIHISTDQVYDGKGPHGEMDINIRNIYAQTKYQAEIVAQSVGATIFRTNFFGKSKTPNRVSITDWIYQSITNGERIYVFNDIRFSPLSIRSLISIVSDACLNRWNGVYNIGSKNGLTKAEFSFKFVEAIGGNLKLLNPINSNSSKALSAYRPKDMTMKVDRFEEISGYKFQNIEDEILLVSKEYARCRPI